MKQLNRLVGIKRQMCLKCITTLILSFIVSAAYSQKISVLKSNLNALKYDSVKVFSFNCTSEIDVEKYGLIADTSLVTSTQQWAYTVDRKGKIVSDEDLKMLFSILMANEFMKEDSDPAGCYQPRLGFAFFQKGLVVAHIDVCLECSKSIMEIFKPKKTVFRYFFKTLTHTTAINLSSLCKKYNMECCKLHH